VRTIEHDQRRFSLCAITPTVEYMYIPFSNCISDCVRVTCLDSNPLELKTFKRGTPKREKERKKKKYFLVLCFCVFLLCVAADHIESVHYRIIFGNV